MYIEKLKIIKLMTGCIQKISREKIIRIAFTTFKILADNAPETIETMIESGLIKVIDTILKGNIKDNEVIDDLEYVGALLEKNVRILTSFDKYLHELNSQHFDWTPVHSEKFWKENFKLFADKDFETIYKIIGLLNSEDIKTVAIACYDIGEFCRFNPYGKKQILFFLNLKQQISSVIDRLNGKQIILQKAKSQEPLIRENALLALQKIMIHNWQSVNTITQ